MAPRKKHRSRPMGEHKFFGYQLQPGMPRWPPSKTHLSYAFLNNACQGRTELSPAPPPFADLFSGELHRVVGPPDQPTSREGKELFPSESDSNESLYKEEDMAGNGYQSGRGPICCTRPPWLLTILADLESRMQALAGDCPDADKSADSFAERAENYYQRRPELLRLLQDLHNHYLYLADRYCQAALKQQQQHHHFHLPSADSNDLDELHIDSDAESSLSFQTLPALKQQCASSSAELLVVELVAKEVDRAFLADEREELERRMAESGRKTELQQSLLEVLESERLVLLSENARLGYRAEAAEEEGRELAAEAAFMRRRATELARCVVKMRDDHRVCLLGRKIEDLQAQIYGLEKRNKECYEAMGR